MKFDLEFTKAKNTLVENGVGDIHADIIADCLVTADEYGVTSHGTAMLEAHINRIKKGSYNLSPSIRVIRETAAFALVDGDNAIGPVSAMFCLDYAIKKSRDSGVFTVFARNNNTFGPAFYYSLKAAEQGCIAFVCSNSPAQMAPVGGVHKMLGTNPLAAVIPVPGEDPIIIDMATSAVAKSKFKEYKNEGKSLPLGWATDKNGIPTTNPDEAISGLVLPMAGFKGYAISMLIDIISGVLSGAAYLDKVGRFYSDDNSGMNVGYYMTVINPTVVLGEEYNEEISAYVKRLRGSRAAEGKEISLPGDDRLNYRKNN